MKPASETNSPVTVTHTPTPWRVHEQISVRVMSGNYTVCMTDIGSGNSADWEANAAHIVRSVNAMPAILELLEETRLQLTYLDEKFQPTGTTAATLSRLDAMIKEIRK